MGKRAPAHLGDYATDLDPPKKTKKDTSKPAKTVSPVQASDKESDEENKVLDSTQVIAKAIKDLVGFQDGESVDNDPGETLSTFMIAGATLEPKLKAKIW